MVNSAKKILIVAGEASGDKNAARLVERLKQLDPHLEFCGTGGECMRAAGVQTFHDISEMCLTGPYEIITEGWRVLKIYKKLCHYLVEHQPEVLILVDYPEINLRLAKKAHQAGIKVFYYISRQLWAWRRGRVKIVKKYVDMMAVLLPFEADFYRRHGVEAYYVGHPLAAQVQPSLSIPEAKAKFQLDPNPKRRVIGILPGSRPFEVKSVLPLFVKAVNRLYARDPNLQFIMPLASTLKSEWVESYLKTSQAPVTIISQSLYDVLICCDAVMSVFGTVTLEVALLEIPAVLAYRMSLFSALLLLVLVHTPYYGLCNIVAGEEIAVELVQYLATPKRIALEIQRYLDDPAYCAQTRLKLQAMKKRMMSNPSTYDAAELVLKLLAASI